MHKHGSWLIPRHEVMPVEAQHLHDALTQQPVPWRMVLDLERDV